MYPYKTSLKELRLRFDFATLLAQPAPLAAIIWLGPALIHCATHFVHTQGFDAVRYFADLKQRWVAALCCDPWTNRVAKADEKVAQMRRGTYNMLVTKEIKLVSCRKGLPMI